MIGSVSTATGGKTLAAQPDGLKQAAKAFEAVFVRQMLATMREAKLADDLFGSQAGEQFRDMADARTADEMAERGVFGIAELLLKQFGEPAAAKPAADGTAP